MTREELLATCAKQTLPCEAVSVLGGVFVQGLSARARDSFELAMAAKKRGASIANVRAQLLVRCLVDQPGGSLLLTEADVATLGDMPAAVIEPLFDVAQRLSGFTVADVASLAKVPADAGSGQS